MENKTDTKKKTYSKDIVIFAFFLFFSFSLWYINYLGKDIESELKIPVKYVNFPAEKVIEPEHKYINVSLKGTGYSILQLKYNGKDSVLVDFSNVIYKKNNNLFSDSYILTSTIVKSYESQMKAKCEIISMKPDTLYFVIKD